MKTDDNMAAAAAIEIDVFRPGDAAGVVALFREVYGDGYPIKVYYDEQAITEANRCGQIYSAVGRDASGNILGMNNLFRSAPYEGLYEGGAGLVSRQSRGLGVSYRTLSFLFNEFAPSKENVDAVFGEPVCNHTIMQKTVIGMNFRETALEVALMPAAAYEAEKSSSGRVSALVSFRDYRPKPFDVYLPAIYEESLRRIYGEFSLQRRMDVGRAPLPEGVKSQADMTLFDYAQVARIALNETGPDLPEYLDELEGRAVDGNTQVFQAWVKLAHPWSGEVTQVLRDKGYFFGGLLPRWFDNDGMLMQKVLCDPCWDGIKLYSQWAGELLFMARSDWERAGQRRA